MSDINNSDFNNETTSQSVIIVNQDGGQDSSVISEQVIVEPTPDEIQILITDTSSQQAVISEANKPRFRKYAWLDKHFERIGRKGFKCLVCQKVWASNSTERLIQHFRKCTNTESSSQLDIVQTSQATNKVSDTKRTQLLLKTIVENNLPLKLVESASFMLFVESFGRSYVMPTRKNLSQSLLPRLSASMHNEFLQKLHKGVISHISVEFDFWNDANNRSLLGVIATTNEGNRHLIDLVNLSIYTHTSELIVEKLQSILSCIPLKSINAVVSDCGSNCKKARKQLVKLPDYMHIIEHRCLAHLFNTVGSRITNKNEDIKSTVKLASEITAWVSNSSKWLELTRSGKVRKPKPLCVVRWYSTVNMLESLNDNKALIMREVAPTLSDRNSQKLQGFNWRHLDQILEVLRPINDCIGQLEKKDCSLGEAFAKILRYAKGLFTKRESSSILNAARSSFLWYFSPANAGGISKDELSLFIAAYILDHRFNQYYITTDGLDLGLVEIIKTAIRSGANVANLQLVMFEQLSNYTSRRETFGSSSPNEAPVKYWLDRLGHGALPLVGLRLAHLKASSANIERTFSTIRYIQGSNRLNFSIENLINIARIKISTAKDCSDEDLIDDLYLDSGGEQVISETLSQASVISDNSDSISSLSTDSELENSWLEDVDSETRVNYNGFIRYFDFSIRPTSQPIPARGSTVRDMSSDDIIAGIRAARLLSDQTQQGVFVENCYYEAATFGSSSESA